jgi:hypothetical protein
MHGPHYQPQAHLSPSLKRPFVQYKPCAAAQLPCHMHGGWAWWPLHAADVAALRGPGASSSSLAPSLSTAAMQSRRPCAQAQRYSWGSELPLSPTHTAVLSLLGAGPCQERQRRRSPPAALHCGPLLAMQGPLRISAFLVPLKPKHTCHPLRGRTPNYPACRRGWWPALRGGRCAPEMRVRCLDPLPTLPESFRPGPTTRPTL